MKPLVTIVTVVFNGVSFLEETILSVINQTHNNIEYIIIDGGSTDGTLDIIRKYEHVINYWISEKDEGIYDAMNKGIERATGDWINFMNGGDVFFSNKVLSNVLNTLSNDCQVCFGKSLTYYGDQSVLRFEDFESHDTEFYLRKMPNHQAIFIREDIYKKLKYSLDLRYCSDTDYLRRVFSVATFCEYSGVVSKFELGGVSNFYGKFSVYWLMVSEYQKLGYGFYYSFFAHSFKYLLQLFMGKDKYLKFYIKKLVKK